MLVKLLHISAYSVSLLEILKILGAADQSDLLELPRALVEKSGHLLTCTDAAADRRFGLLLVPPFVRICYFLSFVKLIEFSIASMTTRAAF